MADIRGVAELARPMPRAASWRSALFGSAGRAVEVAVPAEEAPHFHYCAFLSYGHRDAETARWLHEALEKYRVPVNLVGRSGTNGIIPARLCPIFRDRHELAASADLGRDIRDALATSRFLIVLCSPAAAVSRWTGAEIDSFKKMRPDGCVLAAIIEGEPFASEIPGREAEECFPPALRHAYDKRGRPTKKRAEPIAADLRESGDGRRLGFLKIVAGMLGVGLDDLVQRESVRRQKRLRLIAGASLLGMAVTSTLSVVAFEARDEARDQRREAEGLVGFMLGDLRQKLEPLGRLDVLDAVGARALGYFEQQNKFDLSEAALSQRSKALTLLGEIASSRGDLDGALRRYQEAMTGSAEALRRMPDDPQRIYEHAQNVYWVGDVAMRRDQTKQAEAMMRKYKRLADQLVTIDPSNARWQMEAIYGDANLGIVLQETKRYREAADIFQSSLGRTERLAASAPGNENYRKSLIETLAWLADAREGEGRIDDALTQRERQITLLTPLIARSSGDAANKRQMMVAQRAAGRLFAMRGDLQAGLDHLGAAVRIGGELMRTEPDNADWAGQAAGAYIDYGELQLAAGQGAAAGAAARIGCDISNRVTARDATVKRWRVDLRTACLKLRARLALASGSGAEAHDLASRMVTLAREENAANLSVDSRLALSSAHVFRAMVAARNGDEAAARAAYRQAFAAWQKNLALSPALTAQHVLLLDGLGRRVEADEVAGKLAAIGYRHPTYLRDRAMVQYK